ncbi:MAG: hypothetical protein ACP5XB_31260 [Isosphaeraceae bacterium]
MSDKTAFILVSGFLFSVVALIHAIRLALRWKVRVDSRELPMWFSVLGFLVATALSAWAFWLLL